MFGEGGNQTLVERCLGLLYYLLEGVDCGEELALVLRVQLETMSDLREWYFIVSRG